jgi:hypothetical protein
MIATPVTAADVSDEEVEKQDEGQMPVYVREEVVTALNSIRTMRRHPTGHVASKGERMMKVESLDSGPLKRRA